MLVLENKRLLFLTTLVVAYMIILVIDLMWMEVKMCFYLILSLFRLTIIFPKGKYPSVVVCVF